MLGIRLSVYPKLIDNLITKKRNKLLLNKLYVKIEEKVDKKYCYLNFKKHVSHKIQSKLINLGLTPITCNKMNLGSLIVNNKDKQNILEKNGVYEIKCANCDAIYIGQTGRSLNKRIMEHKKSIQNNKNVTGFSIHCIENNHCIDPNYAKLLHFEPKGNRLNYLEILEIQKARRQGKYVTNEQIEFKVFPLIKSVIT